MLLRSKRIVGPVEAVDSKVRGKRKGEGEKFSLKRRRIADKIEDKPPITAEGSCALDLNTILAMLPSTEVKNLIFERLDYFSKLNARLVCSQWKGFVDKTVEWAPLMFDKNAKDVVEFAQKGYPVSCLTISKLENFRYPGRGIGFTDVEEIRFIYYSDCKCNKEEDICLCGASERGGGRWRGINQRNLSNLLKEAKNVKSMSLHSRQFSEVEIPSPFRTVQLHQLTTLEISTLNSDGRGYRVCADILFNYFPSLSSFEITLFNKENSQLQDQHPLQYLELYEFLLKHKNTLKDISLSFRNLLDDRDLPNIVFFLFPRPGNYNSEYAERHGRVLKGLQDLKGSEMQLENYSYSPNCYEGTSVFTLGKTLLSKQTILKTVEIRHLTLTNLTNFWVGIPEVLTRCSGTLESIIIKGCFCPENGEGVIQFSCRTLKRCSKLECLKLDVCGMEMTNLEDLPKNIKTLSLGPSLKKTDIDWIGDNLLKLENLALMQGASSKNPQVPKVNLEIFKGILKSCKSFKKMKILKTCSTWKRIRKMISYTKGISWEPHPEFKEKILIFVNRKILDEERL